MTTLGELANRVQGIVDDETATEWSQALVEEWCVEGVRDYNQHFPRTKWALLMTVAGQREYELPADLRRVVSVEYPEGEERPRYLARRDRLGEGFRGPGWYDVVESNDATTAGKLVLSARPPAGEGIEVVYLADHELALTAQSVVTMPARHEGLIVEFVIWRAWLELLAGEQQAPTSNSSLLMSQYASNADRAKRSYVESLARALRAREGASGRTTWRLDKWDGRY